MEKTKKVNQILELMDDMLNDGSVPRNIKKAILEAKNRLKDTGDLKVRVSGAIYLVQSVSDDINIPSHARTQLWALLSELESLA
jgi:uncharacterized protein (UPF0147 family)